MKKFLILAAAAFATVCGAEYADACTRVCYAGKYAVATGRTLDWRTPIPTALRTFPRGERHESYDDPAENLTWTSKYGSVCAISYDMGAAEGLNEAGLAVNVLYLPGAVYSLPEGKEHRKKMSTSVWPLYYLDNFATVEEAMTATAKDLFYLDAPAMADGSAATLHMALSDSTGNCAVIEYKDGVLQTHVGKEYNVLTNAPFYDNMLAVRDYWQEVGGMNMLPGTNRSTDRFARASFYRSVLPDTLDHTRALAAVFGITRNCAVPMCISVPGRPEISTTQWSTLCDQTEVTYYFQLTQSPSVVWIDLREAKLAPGSPQQTLQLTTDGSQVGKVNHLMQDAKPFKPFFHP